MNNMLFSFFLRGTGGDFIIWIDFILGWIMCRFKTHLKFL
jgi:hypothetical protein